MLSIGGSLQAGAAAGMALAAVVALCIGTNYVIVRRHRAIGMTPALALAGVLAALASLPFAHPSTLALTDLPWLLALGPGQLSVGLLLYMAALKRIPAGRAALLGLLEIVLGPIWVWLVDGEKPGVLTLLGGVVVIGSAAANVWLDSRRPTG
jgi:drug/metabolite transporter (DMT)-like permease